MSYHRTDALREIGEIEHIAGSGRVIIRISEPLSEGQVLCDKGGTRVARVMELIGPVSEPFASAAPLTNSIKKYVGKAVFAVQQDEGQDGRHREDSNKRHRHQDSHQQTRRNAQRNRRRR